MSNWRGWVRASLMVGWLVFAGCNDGDEARPVPLPTATATVVPVTLYRAPELAAPAGPRADGTGVLPNGRIVTPLGRQAALATLPLNLRVGPGGQVFVTNDGFGDDDFARYLQIVDPHTLEVQRTSAEHFFGLAVSADGSRVYAANGPADRVDVFAFDGTHLSALSGASITFPAKTFPMGLEISPDGTALFAIGFLSNSFWRVDLASGTAQEANAKIGNFPYAVMVSPDGRRAYVSSWGINSGNPGGLAPVPLPPTDPNGSTRSSVAVIDVNSSPAPTLLTYVPIGRNQKVDNKTIFGGSHPSAMALSPDGTLLYVTATNLDLLAVVDTATNQEIAEVDLNSFGDGLQGLYPDALAVNAAGTRLYVADAGINAVQVVEVDAAARTFVPSGFIPTGWYPSALGLSADGATLYVASAKGLGVGANGGTVVDVSTQTMSDTPYYIGRLIKGMLSAIDLSSIDLARGTAIVRANNGLDPVTLDPASSAAAVDNPVPVDFGAGPSTQIQYVVYILKENRTYDQILGDLAGTNGDPQLTLFGEDVTPNTHALARQYAVGDNFFDDAEVSYPGHEWVTQGNDNDWVEKIWPFDYNGNLAPSYNIESGQEGFCKGGYIFEALERQQVSYRVYGEALAFASRFAAGSNGRGVSWTIQQLVQAFGSLPALVAHITDLLAGDLDALRAAGVNVDALSTVVWPNLRLDYPSTLQPDKTDVFRAQLFLADLAQFTAKNEMPRFVFIWLPNDHTFGAAPHMPTPDTAVADNDQGLGMIVDALGKSPFWPHMAIFVTEDDAQDGQDHVSAHRTVSLLISPYGKHAYVSGTHASNVGMLKTMELLLGLEPMSQYDRYATDMRDYFTPLPDLAPFTALAARVAAAQNPDADTAGNALLREAAQVSSRLDLSDYDRAGPELSRVLWLVHAGERLERTRRLAALAAGIVLTMLLVGALLFRHRSELAAASRRAAPQKRDS